MVNACFEYTINGLKDEYDTKRQLPDSDIVVTRAKIDTMIATKYERLQTESSAAGSQALEAFSKRRHLFSGIGN